MFKRLAILSLLLAALLLLPSPAFAEERACGTRSWSVDPGKSGTGFKASATDGCHTYEWVNTAGRGPGEGSVTFRTSHVLNGWEPGSTLPSMAGGDANYCAYQAAHEANMVFVNYFQVPDGTEVRVTYSCK